MSYHNPTPQRRLARCAKCGATLGYQTPRGLLVSVPNPTPFGVRARRQLRQGTAKVICRHRHCKKMNEFEPLILPTPAVGEAEPPKILATAVAA